MSNDAWVFLAFCVLMAIICWWITTHGDDQFITTKKRDVTPPPEPPMHKGHRHYEHAHPHEDYKHVVQQTQHRGAPVMARTTPSRASVGSIPHRPPIIRHGTTHKGKQVESSAPTPEPRTEGDGSDLASAILFASAVYAAWRNQPWSNETGSCSASEAFQGRGGESDGGGASGSWDGGSSDSSSSSDSGGSDSSSE